MTLKGGPLAGKKYTLVADQWIVVGDETLYRIRALKDFGHVKAGMLGGFVASTRNLSQSGNCWVADDACVYEEAFISDDAQIRGLARVCGRARIFDNGQVLGCAHAGGDVWIFKNAIVFDLALLDEHAQVRDDGRVYGRARLSGFVRVVGSGEVFGDTRLCGRAVVGDEEKVKSSSRGAPPRGGGHRNRPPSPRPPRP